MAITALEIKNPICDECDLCADFAIYDGAFKVKNLCTYHKNILFADNLCKSSNQISKMT